MPRKTPRPATRSPRWHRRPGARPEEILAAARRVFADAGYGGARLSEVARAAGVSKATLYLYFASKAELFAAMVRGLVRVTPEPLLAASSFFPDSGPKKLARFLRDSWTALRQPELRHLLRLVYAERVRFPELDRFYREEILRPLQERLEPVLAAGRARGEFRSLPHDFALEALPSLLLHQALLRELPGDPAPLGDEEFLAAALDWALGGLLRHGTRQSAE